ncbi:cysteine hydrolase family protein [Streptomyces spectabilis]|uniref:Cysteine hydrolase n=1 Tax=Streptomyces spectabilis TaxID=68270 RepID=A0A5P2XKY0_STRST|nr:cysteine hydrolase [Streptomyces spectabilis]MBB5102178.1 nicotinamidase-related amidase [Streptomyces spectabilis]MCI3907226.1 cysteine hydrolase [Streptomyces spectabilis]QEV63969.1 cysteine hydrolase [Streptomyces spectabilis]GGV29252.1 hydrolase [Streptomyces spectabilis]
MTNNTALLVMDVQRDVVDVAHGRGALAGAAPGVEAGDSSAYLARLGKAIDGARAAGMPVIYVVMGLRADKTEVSPRNKIVTNVVRIGLFTEGNPGNEIHPDIAPQEGDIVVTKRRGSAFSGSDLDLVLRARDINGLVLTGIATSGVVLHTVCAGNDLDLDLTVLGDACLDLDPEVHRFLTEKLFPQWFDVLTVDEWVTTLTR